MEQSDLSPLDPSAYRLDHQWFRRLGEHGGNRGKGDVAQVSRPL
jgi:hypothetical protein